MNSVNRRTRNINYSYKETEALIRNLERPEISSKMGDPKTYREQTAMWEEIAFDVSRAGGQHRTGHEVRKKWQDLKCRVVHKAKKIEEHVKEFGDASSCPLFIDPLQERVLALCKLISSDGSSPPRCKSEPLPMLEYPVCVSSYVAAEDNAEMIYNSQPVLLIPVVMENNQETRSCLENGGDRVKDADPIIESAVSLSNAEVPDMDVENSLQSGVKEVAVTMKEASPIIETIVSLHTAERPDIDVENSLQSERTCDCSKKRKLPDVDDNILDDVYKAFVELNELQMQQTSEMGGMKDILFKLVKLEEAKLKMKCSKFELNFEALID